MIYRRSPQFRKAYKALPASIKAKVKKAFGLFQVNPHHPSLAVKKMQKHQGIWEGRIDDFYRFTFEYLTDDETDEPLCLFRNIGRHDILDHAP